MEKLIENNTFLEFVNSTPTISIEVKNAQNEIAVDVEQRLGLKKYKQCVIGEDQDVLLKYNTYYKELVEMTEKKSQAIEKGNEIIENFQNVEHHLQMLAKKEEEDLNELMVITNDIVDKIIKKEEFICNQEVDKIKDEFEQKKKEILKLKLHPSKPVIKKKEFQMNPTFKRDGQLQQIGLNIDTLNSWTETTKCSIVFDSNLDGIGTNNILSSRLFGKSKLCFISFDDDGNVFGGFLNTEIKKINSWISDTKAFVFSLYRNGDYSPTQYKVKKNKDDNSFALYSNNDCLYQFGYFGDVYVWTIGINGSKCHQSDFEYQNNKICLNDKQDPETFITRRLVVLEME
ncbi:TLDc domain-containing protein [Entamoeba marina]